MGAEFNNGLGISGICVKNELYVYSLDSYELELPDKEREDDISQHVFEVKIALGILVEKNVKVINFSYGLDVMAYAATYGNDEEKANAINYLEGNSDYMVDFIDLLLEDYDFLIVTIAGNCNNQAFYQYDDYIGEEDDTKSRYFGYINVTNDNELEPNVDYSQTYGGKYSGADVAPGDIDARYSCVFNYISESSSCYDHTICVGAIANSNNNVATFSNRGERVDLYAPGVNIYSCSIDPFSGESIYQISEGTSFAAPYVSGAIGLAYNVDPTIRATDLKESLINTAYGNVLNCAALIRLVKNNAVSRENLCQVVVNIKDSLDNPIQESDIEIHQRTYVRVPYFGGVRTPSAISGVQPMYPEETNSQGYATFYLREGLYYLLINNGDEGGMVYLVSISTQSMGTRMYIEIEVSDYSSSSDVSASIQLSNTNTDQLEEANVVVNCREGWNNSSGTICVSETTSESGGCSISIPTGSYTVEIIRNGKSKFYNVIFSESHLIYVLSV